MARRALSTLIVLAAAAASCGCVQRAVLLPVLMPQLTALTSTLTRSAGGSAVTNGPAPGGADGQVAKEGRRFILRAEDSKLEVRGGDLLTGMHVMRFARWRGAFIEDADAAPGRPSGRLTLDIELRSLTTDAIVDDSLRHHLLEVERFPRARFALTLRPRTDQEDGHVALGRILVHGIERVIRFHASLRREGDGYRIGTEFDMSREEFDMHRKDSIDLVIYDDFRVVLDLFAHPEQVSAEVLAPD